MKTLRYCLLSLTLLMPTAASAQLTLGAAADAALATHPSLAASRARVDAADRGLGIATSARLPSVSVNLGLTRFQKPMVVAPFHNLDFQTPPEFDRSLVQGRLGLQYTLFDGGARGARIRGARARADAARDGRDADEMSLLESVASAYLGVLSASVVRDAAGRQLSALDEELSRARDRFSAGTAARVEVLRASASLQDARAQLESANARLGLAERALARVTGLDRTAVRASQLREVVTVGGPSPTDWSESPLIHRAGNAVAAAQARVDQERATRLPHLETTAGLLDFSTLSGGHTTEWQTAVQLSWPIFLGGARRSAIRQAQSDAAAARADLALVELNVAQAMDAAWTAVAEADARVTALEASVSQWQEVARIEALALAAGSGVQADRLRAEAGLFRARAGYAAARHDAALARVALARAQGVLDRNWLDSALETRR
jgi:outer membrane protein